MSLRQESTPSRRAKAVLLVGFIRGDSPRAVAQGPSKLLRRNV